MALTNLSPRLLSNNIQKLLNVESSGAFVLLAKPRHLRYSFLQKAHQYSHQVPLLPTEKVTFSDELLMSHWFTTTNKPPFSQSPILLTIVSRSAIIITHLRGGA
jgi:hypothetical protein